MEAKPGRLVKAVYDFPTEDEEELSLRIGDIIQVKERIDKQWSRGVCAGREGNFPIGFTVDIKIPELAEHQQLFATTDDFIAQEKGDLTLQRDLGETHGSSFDGSGSDQILKKESQSSAAIKRKR